MDGKHNRVVIEVSGGVVQSVRADDPTTEIILVDWDNIDAGDPEPEVPEDMPVVF